MAGAHDHRILWKTQNIKKTQLFSKFLLGYTYFLWLSQLACSILDGLLPVLFFRLSFLSLFLIGTTNTAQSCLRRRGTRGAREGKEGQEREGRDDGEGRGRRAREGREGTHSLTRPNRARLTRPDQRGGKG